MASKRSKPGSPPRHAGSAQPTPTPATKPAPLTSAQIRAARALLRWTAEDLARETAVSVTTIRRAELTESETALTVVNNRAIREAFERAGVTFIDANGGGPGVRFRDSTAQATKG